MYILILTKRQWPGIWKRLPHAWSFPDMRFFSATPWCLCSRRDVDLLILHLWGPQRRTEKCELLVPKKTKQLVKTIKQKSPGSWWKEGIFRTPQHLKGEKKIDKNHWHLTWWPPGMRKTQTDLCCDSSVFFVPLWDRKRNHGCDTCKSSKKKKNARCSMNDLGPGFLVNVLTRLSLLYLWWGLSKWLESTDHHESGPAWRYRFWKKNKKRCAFHPCFRPSDPFPSSPEYFFPNSLQ